MGCASSKKRTTSIDDLTGQNKQKEPIANSEPAPTTKKNGQAPTVNSTDSKPIQKDSAGQLSTSAAPPSEPIQITGKSFLAPEGIPFIDEDVDEDEDGLGGSGTRTSVVVAKADVNKNVVVQQRDSRPTSVEASTKPTIVVAGAERTSAAVVAPPAAPRPKTEEEEEDERKRAIATDILRQELQITTARMNEADHASGTVVSETVIVTKTETHTVTQEESPRPLTAEEQERAAVKIQAGIRGYRDRQRVKALRAAKEHPEDSHFDADQAHNVHAEHESSPEYDAAVKIQASFKGYKARQQVKAMKEHAAEEHGEAEHNEAAHVESNELEHLSVEPSGAEVEVHTPEMERAATKIQASYKGYKTRKEYKLHH